MRAFPATPLPCSAVQCSAENCIALEWREVLPEKKTGLRQSGVTSKGAWQCCKHFGIKIHSGYGNNDETL